MNSSATLFGIGVYLGLNLAVGAWASRQVRGGADFIVAGRRLPLGLATATLFATWFGGGTCIGAAGAAYQRGLLGVIADPFGAALCLFLSGWFFARPLRRMRILTIGDFFRIRYGRSSERLVSILQAPPFIGWAAAQLVAFGTVLHVLAGFDQTTAIILAAAVIFAYTAAGGMWAVAVTDLLQGIVLVVGLVYLAPVVIAGAGGVSAVAAALPAGRLDFFPAGAGREWLGYLQAWLVIGLGSIPSQDLLQRTLSARDETTAARGAHLAGLLYLTVGLIPVLLGIVASAVMPGLEDPELALPLIGQRYLGPVGTAVFIGALLSAILSSSDSALLAPASVISENIVKPLRPGLSDAALLRVTRVALGFCVGAALLLALRFRGVYQLMLTAMEAGVAGLIVPYAAGLYWPRANGWSAVAGMSAGTATWAAASLLRSPFPADLLGLAVSLIVAPAVALRTGRRNPPLPLADVDGRPLG